MILKILSGTDMQELDGDSYVISTNYLQHKAVHLYIASQQWDGLYCELDDSIPLDCLKHVKTKVKQVTVKLPEVVTKTTMLLLTELYPDKAGSIRKQFMSGKDLREVI